MAVLSCSGCALRFVVRLAAIVFCLSSFPQVALSAPAPAVPGQYIIKFKPTSRAQDRSALKKQLGGKTLQKLSFIGGELIELTNKAALSKEQEKELLNSGSIEYIEPNYLYSIDTTPNDTNYAEQWSMNSAANADIDAPEAWNISTGSSDIVVGIVDTGIEYTHLDLAANIWTNPRETPGDGIDNDGNGYIDDIHGINALTGSGDPLDDHSHGTHCAGVIGGVGNNGKGVTGVNWRLKMMALKFLDASGSGSTAGAIAAIEYAIAMKRQGVNLRVLSNSWGGGGASAALEDAISEAEAENILFVAAAGNSSTNNDTSPTYPASYELGNVISVAAIDSAGNLASFSNFGSGTVDLAAPGVSILSTVINGHYGLMSGTSMATPHVSGVAALVLARENLSAEALKQRLLQTAKPLSGLTDLLLVPGVIDAYNAVTNTISPLPPPAAQTQYTKHDIAFAELERGSMILEADDAYSVQQLPFSFPYYKENYSSIVISTNGRILFGDTPPATADYLNRLAEGLCVYHTDLTVSQTIGNGETGVYFYSTPEEAVITWVMVNYALRSTTDENSLVRFQARLHRSGAIEYLYGDTVVGDPNYDFGAVATIGLAPPTGVSGAKLSVSNNEANPNEIGSGRALSFARKSMISGADFDGDGTSDIVVWRPSSGTWYVLLSSRGFDFSQHLTAQFGLPGDVPVPGDYDGDAKADYAVWRPSDGNWYLLLSSTGALSVIQWGLAGDKPIPDDYDGDGKTDLAVQRGSIETTYGLLSSSGYDREGALTGRVQALMVIRTGGVGYDTVSGDFNGDGKADIASIWQLIRFWTALDYTGTMLFSAPWGEPGDSPVVCDRDGDGTADRTMSRVNGSNLLEHFTVTGTGSVFVNTMGSLGDEARCRDYDGDGKGDLTAFRPHTGEWFIRSSRTGLLSTLQFGLPGDRAL